jgi:hypothetical protein
MNHKQAEDDQNRCAHIPCTLLQQTHYKKGMALYCYVNTGININYSILMTHRPQSTAGWKNTKVGQG